MDSRNRPLPTTASTEASAGQGRLVRRSSSRTSKGSGRTRERGAQAAVPPAGRVLLERVRGILDQIRPAVQEDGGDVELVDITPEGVVQVRLHGACVGCPSSNVTLQSGIERNLRLHVPEVTGVVAVD